MEGYIDLLYSDKDAPDKFWELEERIRKDKKKPGVVMKLHKSKIVWDLAKLIKTVSLKKQI